MGEQMGRVIRDQDTSSTRKHTLEMKTEKDEIKHKIQIMKMKKSMTRLELSIADSTHSQTLQQQQQQHGLSIVDSDEMLSGDLLYDEMLSEEFIELNDEDLDIQNDEEKNEKS